MTLRTRVDHLRRQGQAESPRVVRVYLAAPFELQAAARVLRDDLERLGIGCTSRWLNAASRDEGPGWARRWLADLDHADVLVALNPETWRRAGTGGRHVELGYALAQRKPVLVVGARTNVFHFLSEVAVVDVARGAAVRAADIVPSIQRLLLVERAS